MRNLKNLESYHKKSSKMGGFAFVWILGLFCTAFVLVNLSIQFINLVTNQLSRQRQYLLIKGISEIALKISIGNAQANLGPDNRLTFNGQFFFDKLPKDMKLNLAKDTIENKKFWLGTLESKRDEICKLDKISWLVSSKKENLPQKESFMFEDYKLENTCDFLPIIRQAIEEGCFSKEYYDKYNDSILVEKVPVLSINGNLLGNYAYWIEEITDENENLSVLSDISRQELKQELSCYLRKNPEKKFFENVPSNKFFQILNLSIGTHSRLNNFFEMCNMSNKCNNYKTKAFLFDQSAHKEFIETQTIESNLISLIKKNANSHDSHGLSPVLVQFVLGYNCSKESNQKVNLHAYPGVSVWNPYNKTIEEKRYSIEYSVQKKNGPPKINIISSVCTNQGNISEKNIGSEDFVLASGTFSAKFSPGEIKFFSCDENNNWNEQKFLGHKKIGNPIDVQMMNNTSFDLQNNSPINIELEFSESDLSNFTKLAFYDNSQNEKLYLQEIKNIKLERQSDRTRLFQLENSAPEKPVLLIYFGLNTPEAEFNCLKPELRKKRTAFEWLSNYNPRGIFFDCSHANIKKNCIETESNRTNLSGNTSAPSFLRRFLQRQAGFQSQNQSSTNNNTNSSQNESKFERANWFGIYVCQKSDTFSYVINNSQFCGSFNSENFRPLLENGLIVYKLPKIESLAHLRYFNANILGNCCSFPIGNSMFHEKIPRENFMYSKNICFGEMYYDFSYLLNKEIWDKFFVIPNSQDFFRNDSNSRFQNLENRNFSELQLPSYLKFIDENKKVNVSHNLAKNLWLKGGFCVNNTNASDWKKFLQKHFCNTLEKLNSQTKDNFSLEKDIFLTDHEIEKFSQSIANQVKFRAPFNSMSDFVNRRLICEKDDIHKTGLKGTIQAALEDCHLSENKTHKPRIENKPLKNAIKNKSLENKIEFESFKDFDKITQANILEKIGSYLTIRSDTFRIWVYAEGAFQKNLKGIQSKVLDEKFVVTIQRHPEFVDQNNSPETSHDELSFINKKLGRKFRIKSINRIGRN